MADNALKLWPITVTHPRTKATIRFLGQGTTVLEAVTDGAKNCGEVFRPSQSGGNFKPGAVHGPSTVCVEYPDGRKAFLSLREFEADPTPAPGQGPETKDQRPEAAEETLDFA